MQRNTFLLFFIAVLVYGCASPSKKANQKLDEFIGFVHQGCLAINNSTLKNGTELTLVRPGEQPSFGIAKIDHKKTEAEACVILLEDRKSVNLESNFTFYQIAIEGKEEIDMAIVVAASGLSQGAKGNLLGMDVNSDGKVEYFDICTSSEGLHFSAWEGEPFKSKRLWNSYYYLGYDLEPTCPN